MRCTCGRAIHERIARARAERPVSRRFNLLLVEDEVGIRDAFALLLELEGFHVQTAVDGLDAIDLLARTPVDLVVTDLMMPRLDGLELARRIRAAQGSSPPIVMITAASESAAQARALVDAVLVKPFDANALLDTIHRLLARG
jgi:DNA-binding response OmpR family regulator